MFIPVVTKQSCSSTAKSFGRKKMAAFEYRLRWDDVKYAPGELKVVGIKSGKQWATDVVKTAGPSDETYADDRSCDDCRGWKGFVIRHRDGGGQGRATRAARENQIQFEIEGPGEIVATDNGDATSFESFQAPERKAFNGLALVIVRAKAGESGKIKLAANSQGLVSSSVMIRTK